MLECVINISEGRQIDAIEQIRRALGHDVLDIHSDYHHHRSVFTTVGANTPHKLAELCSKEFDLSKHLGVHPRIGIIDVVPFVPLEDSTIDQAITARNEFAEFAASKLAIPSFVYGPERDLPEIRKNVPCRNLLLGKARQYTQPMLGSQAGTPLESLMIPAV